MIIQDHAKDRSAGVHPITAGWLTDSEVMLDVLRLDKIHPVVSGNKWFKLKYYLEDVKNKKYSTIATFGGAYSNHIAATAYACKEFGFKSVGVIRGEQPSPLSHTLNFAQEHEMELMFVSREDYRNREVIKKSINDVYWIDEGGYGALGVKGASEILQHVHNLQEYSHVVTAVGTGTTLAGIIEAALPHQQIIGVSAMKGNEALSNRVNELLITPRSNFFITHNYHVGGYARYTKELLIYMNELWQQHNLPTDFVYTAKTFFAVQDLVENKIIPCHSKVLMIHTGGLQGNLSLPYNALLFS